MLGNLKSIITGTCRVLRETYLLPYLAEFEWRFDLAATIPALGSAALAKPLPFWRLKMADSVP